MLAGIAITVSQTKQIPGKAVNKLGKLDQALLNLRNGEVKAMVGTPRLGILRLALAYHTLAAHIQCTCIKYGMINPLNMKMKI